MTVIVQSRSPYGIALKRPFQSFDRAKVYVCKQLASYIIQEYINNNFTSIQYLDTTDEGNVTIATPYQNDLALLEALVQPFLASGNYMTWEIISSS